ncbi:4Fe-4S binding protein [bacterium]|nr:4Fe-4S binding protein [bacterium]
MADENLALHFACTRDEAMKFVDDAKSFWVANCGCRKSGKGCTRSRMDVCLQFRLDENWKAKPTPISLNEVKTIFQEAKEKHLVTRPFRNQQDKARIDGICFCCDDCCGYFLNSEEVCDKGKLIEETSGDDCINCGACISVCYFKARKMKDGALSIERNLCYGCGLCLDVCPVDCIKMVQREA